MARELIYAPGHDRGRSLGWLASAWTEHFTVHGPGDVQGDDVDLDDEFAGFLVDAYALDGHGRRQYSRAVLSRAKGRAKSEIAGFVGLFEAFGPCRFCGWAKGGETYQWRDFAYTYEPGEPMGQPLVYPYIRCLATEESQTGNTFDVIHFNLTEGPLSEDLPKNAAGLTRVLLPGGGEIVPSTASSSAKDGGKESLAIFDEPHLYITPELRRMFKTVDRNLRKRKAAQPWGLLTSTMYQAGEDSTLEALDQQAKAIREGRTRSARLLWDHREAPADVDLTDLDAMVAALREVYGPAADWMDLPGIVENEFWDLTKAPEESRRYFFNQRSSAATAWTTDPEWSACHDPERPPLLDGDTVVMFFDGSKNDDATGLVAVRMSDGHAAVLHCQEKPEGPAGRRLGGRPGGRRPGGAHRVRPVRRRRVLRRRPRVRVLRRHVGVRVRGPAADRRNHRPQPLGRRVRHARQGPRVHSGRGSHTGGDQAEGPDPRRRPPTQAARAQRPPSADPLRRADPEGSAGLAAQDRPRGVPNWCPACSPSGARLSGVGQARTQAHR